MPDTRIHRSRKNINYTLLSCVRNPLPKKLQIWKRSKMCFQTARDNKKQGASLFWGKYL